MNVRVLIAEVKGVSTTGDIYVILPASPHFTINPYSSTLTTSAGLPVQNNQWSLVSSSEFEHVFKFGGTSGLISMPANARSAFGFSINYSALGGTGHESISAYIFDGSGGELNYLNNVDYESISYSPQ